MTEDEVKAKEKFPCLVCGKPIYVKEDLHYKRVKDKIWQRCHFNCVKKVKDKGDFYFA